MTALRFLAIILLAVLSFSRNAFTAAEPEAIKIGVQLPITGERAPVGKLMANGLQMALEAINARKDGKGIKLAITVADDGSSADGAVKAAKELVTDPSIVAIAGEINSPYVLASVPVINEAEIPYLTAGSSPKTTAASPWIFRVGVSDALLADVLTRYIVQDLHMKSIAILHDKVGVHNQRAELIASVLRTAYGISTVADAAWTSGDRDFVRQLQQAQANHADILVAFGETPEGGLFLKQASSVAKGVQVIAQRDFGVKRVLEEAGDGAEGALVITEYSPELQGEGTQAWNTAYRRHFGADANIIAAQYYDALMLLAEAVEKGGPTRKGVKAGLEKIKAFPGIVADYTFDAERNGIHRFYVAKVVKGKLSTVKILDETSRH